MTSRPLLQSAILVGLFASTRGLCQVLLQPYLVLPGTLLSNPKVVSLEDIDLGLRMVFEDLKIWDGKKLSTTIRNKLNSEHSCSPWAIEIGVFAAFHMILSPMALVASCFPDYDKWFLWIRSI
ncbi:hypothetical protein SUGI_0504250 [Cryptomeria japonica]|nr:hypothetical protein SUGI_0504250 [Cryptomeria japonica]